uniref:Uncharacterized protein n=1 Tax=Micrurus corallinus TaxID=54390 RepID=A0A2D4GIB4_MICCO
MHRKQYCLFILQVLKLDATCRHISDMLQLISKLSPQLTYHKHTSQDVTLSKKGRHLFAQQLPKHLKMLFSFQCKKKLCRLHTLFHHKSSVPKLSAEIDIDRKPMEDRF